MYMARMGAQEHGTTVLCLPGPHAAPIDCTCQVHASDKWVPRCRWLQWVRCRGICHAMARAAPDPHLYAKTGVRWSEKMRVTMGTKLKPLRAPSQKRANSSRCSGAVALCAECPVLDEVDGLTA